MIFKIDWVLKQQLAIGPAPVKKKHIELLKENGIEIVFSLCSEVEANPPEEMKKTFRCERLVLPDHKSNRIFTFEELNEAVTMLQDLKSKGIVFVHCVAAVERSPSVCMGLLIREKKLSLQQALDYLMQLHPGTNPLPGQLDVLNLIK